LILCDASALIALLSRRDNNHQRCIDVLPKLQPPLITTLPCFVEGMYLLGRDVGWLGQKALWSYIENQDLLFYTLEASDILRMRSLMEQYQDLPMYLADASLVAAAESLNQRQIFTLDSDFYIYRFQGKLSFEIFP
jgi:predicted nucleic acid-binding protein